jgi:hypothetical protein
VTPPYVALEVEQAPAAGKLPELADMLDLLTSAVERLEKQVGVRAHLTRAPVGLLKRWVGRLRRLHRSRGAVAIVLLLALGTAGLGVTFWVGNSDPDPNLAPMLISGDSLRNSTGYSLWVALANAPPCYEGRPSTRASATRRYPGARPCRPQRLDEKGVACPPKSCSYSDRERHLKDPLTASDGT